MGAPGDEQGAAYAHATHCLSECEALTSTLKDSLQLERRALEARDQQGLDEAVERKRECIARLREADPRAQLAPHASPGPRPLGTRALEAHLEALDGSGSLGATWRSLRALTVECQQLNDRNGLLTTRLRNRAEQTLLLIQSAAGQETPTPVYGRDGILSSAVVRLPGSRS